MVTEESEHIEIDTTHHRLCPVIIHFTSSAFPSSRVSAFYTTHTAIECVLRLKYSPQIRSVPSGNAVIPLVSITQFSFWMPRITCSAMINLHIPPTRNWTRVLIPLIICYSVAFHT